MSNTQKKKKSSKHTNKTERMIESLDLPHHFSRPWLPLYGAREE